MTWVVIVWSWCVGGTSPMYTPVYLV